MSDHKVDKDKINISKFIFYVEKKSILNKVKIQIGK